MKKAKPRLRKPTATAGSTGTFLVAMTLANEVAEFMAADEEHRRDLAATALAVGEWLAEVKRPGRWDTLEVAKVLEMMGPGPPTERDRFLLTLVGLLGYAAIDGQLAEAAAARCLREIASLTDDPIITRFATETADKMLTPESADPVGGPAALS